MNRYREGKLAGFSFGFPDGEEKYRPETDDAYEAVRWDKTPYVILLMVTFDGSYRMVYSSHTTRNGDIHAHVEKDFELKEFDPLAFKCIANEWYGLIPAEVT